MNMEEEILRCDPETIEDFVLHCCSESPWLLDEVGVVGLPMPAKLRLICLMSDWCIRDPQSAPSYWSWAADVTAPPSSVTNDRSRWPRSFKTAFEFCEKWIVGDSDNPPVLPSDVFNALSREFGCGNSIENAKLSPMRVAEHGHRLIVEDLDEHALSEEACSIDESGAGVCEHSGRCPYRLKYPQASYFEKPVAMWDGTTTQLIVGLLIA